MHSSNRRPEALKDEDYDHEINLVDEDEVGTSIHRLESLGNETSDQPSSPDLSSRRESDAPLHKHHSLRDELTKRKYAKYQDRHLEAAETSKRTVPDQTGDNLSTSDLDEERGRSSAVATAKKNRKKPETAIDILYENQRGFFLCGMGLFSSRALGNLDPSPWTNAAQKSSITDPQTAQVPDPTWEWEWREWKVNLTEEVDEDGWEYSFAFAKQFSWHSASWWTSFVRRRAWIRKRVKKYDHYDPADDTVPNPEYFVISSAEERSRSAPSTGRISMGNRNSFHQQQVDGSVPDGDITNLETLMLALKLARIDREKLEVVESFIKHSDSELGHLKDRMHDVMSQFIFQASRRVLLEHLTQLYGEATDAQKDISEDERKANPKKQRHLDDLSAAVKAADEEVQKLEFWSDVKDMAEKGATQGAADESQGWGKDWTGLDASAPKDVISNKELPGTQDCHNGEGNGMSISKKGKENEPII